jgi:hypothetical protein
MRSEGSMSSVFTLDGSPFATLLHGKKGVEIELPKCDNHVEGSSIERYS